MILDFDTGIYESWNTMVYTCPNCQNAYIFEGFKFCPMCGIIIVWADDPKEDKNEHK